MKKLCVLLAVLTLAGCGSLSFLSPTPDPRPAANLEHVQRLVAKDTDPQDAPANAEALSTAQGLAADYGESPSLAAAVRNVGAAAAATGTPWGELLGGVAVLASAILGGLHVSNRRKIGKITKA